MGSPRFFSGIVGKGQGLKQRRSPSLLIDDPQDNSGNLPKHAPARKKSTSCTRSKIRENVLFQRRVPSKNLALTCREKSAVQRKASKPFAAHSIQKKNTD